MVLDVGRCASMSNRPSSREAFVATRRTCRRARDGGGSGMEDAHASARRARRYCDLDHAILRGGAAAATRRNHAFVLALDQGTTSSRAIVFDRDGSVRASAQQEFRQIFPQPGWVEHDADEIWATQSGVMHEALAKAGISGARHRGDRHHQPARDDGRVGARDRQARSPTPSSGRTGAPRRSATSCARAGQAADVRRARPASCSMPTSRAPSCAGCSTTCPARAARARARRARLRHHRHAGSSGTSPAARVHVTDASNASRTLLFDIHTRRLGRRAARAARRAARGAARGRRRRRACARETHARRRRACRSRASPATSRRRCSARRASTPGLAKNTYGTGCFLLLNTGHEGGRVAQQPADDGRVAARRPHSTTRSKAASSSPAPSCSGCATACRSSAAAAEVEALARTRAGQRRRLSRAGVRRARRAALGRVRARRDLRAHARRDRRRTSRAPRSSRSRSRAPTCSTRCRATPASRWPSCASTAARRRTTC